MTNLFLDRHITLQFSKSACKRIISEIIPSMHLEVEQNCIKARPHLYVLRLFLLMFFPSLNFSHFSVMNWPLTHLAVKTHLKCHSSKSVDQFLNTHRLATVHVAHRKEKSTDTIKSKRVMFVENCLNSTGVPNFAWVVSFKLLLLLHTFLFKNTYFVELFKKIFTLSFV